MCFRIALRFTLRFSILSLSLAFVLAASPAAFSQATFPTPVLTSISPLGGSAGQAIQLTFRGSEVEDISSMLLNDRVVPIKPVKGKGWQVDLPQDLQAGLYDLRVAGPFGVSNPRTFEISAEPTIMAEGKNSTPEQAQKVPVGCVIDGVFKAATPQWFSFEAKKGETIEISFPAERFDIRGQPMGAILDAQGREVARLRNALAAFVCNADGTFLLRLNELMHRGGDDYGFRLRLGHLKLAPRWPSNGSQPTPPQPLKVGEAVKDTFPEAGQARVYELPVKAGDKLVFEVRSHQLGHPSDPHLYVETLKPDGTWAPLAQVADAPAITPAPALPLPNLDPVYAYEAKAEGKLRLSLNDNFNTISPFEFSVQPAPGSKPGLIALNPTLPAAGNVKSYAVSTANACRGGILALEVIAPNRHAFSEAVELNAENVKLPAGLTCLGGFIGKGQALGYLAFQAAADAPAGAALISTIPESAHAKFAVADAARDQLLVRRSGSSVVGVSTLAAPALVMSEGGAVFETAADGKLDIPLKITRHADFPEALKLKVLGLTEAAKAPEADIPAKATTGKLTLDLKALKLAAGEHGLILQGPAKMKYRRNLDELTKAEAEAKEAVSHEKETQRKLDAAKADTSPQKQQLIEEVTRTLQKAAAARAAMDQRVKALAARSAPKDATFIVCSNPIRLRVKEAAKK